MLIRPEVQCSPLIATLTIQKNVIRVSFPERFEPFRLIVRGLGYAWEWDCSAWCRQIDERFNGTITDRSAELGAVLLRSGFAVDFPSEQLAQLAIAGTFACEQRRWIKRMLRGSESWFALGWSRTDDLYTAARKIPGSKYVDHQVIVPPDSYNEVLDFAEKHRFSLSAAAQSVVEAAKQRHAAAIVVRLAPLVYPSVPTSTIGEIDPDLRDDG